MFADLVTLSLSPAQPVLQTLQLFFEFLTQLLLLVQLGHQPGGLFPGLFQRQGLGLIFIAQLIQSLAVFQLIMTENAILGMLGALTGMILGCLVGMLITAIGIPMPPPPNADVGYIAQIRLLPLDVLSAGGIGFIATCLAAILPARRASRLKVVDALRQGV